ncbi:hypothetical protein NDU88_002353 [Pleurodeles waltl]|uniref:Uncharacterized protein n=1 Tax=Pleurodeles waltl TaxID=8319 RepID=A0AAV7NG67_PLEWA|nr:hypothetical protein NDU88_002353 [Pleurodeles waltl]
MVLHGVQLHSAVLELRDSTHSLTMSQPIGNKTQIRPKVRTCKGAPPVAAQVAAVWKNVLHLCGVSHWRKPLSHIRKEEGSITLETTVMWYAPASHIFTLQFGNLMEETAMLLPGDHLALRASDLKHTVMALNRANHSCIYYVGGPICGNYYTANPAS